MMTARIAGIGAYVPENLITNDDLSKIVDTNDEWIRTRTGIRERRISSGEGTRHLAAKAAERELPRKSWISSFSGLRPRTGIIPAMPAVFRRPSGQ